MRIHFISSIYFATSNMYSSLHLQSHPNIMQLHANTHALIHFTNAGGHVNMCTDATHKHFERCRCTHMIFTNVSSLLTHTSTRLRKRTQEEVRDMNRSLTIYSKETHVISFGLTVRGIFEH